jgi:zinc protease
VTVTRTRLANGLTLLVEEQHQSPVVALQAWVHIGSADEPEEVAGIAHVHEHMLFKGTARRGVGEIARVVEASGGEINAWTSYDQTVYHLVLAAVELTTGLDILADALMSSAFDASELAREIEVVVEEIRRAEDMPSRRATNALFRQAYASHPYRRPVIGTEKAIRALTRERILQFYRDSYRPDRLTLVAVGDVHQTQVLHEVTRLFGGWRAPTGAAPPPRPAEPVMTETRVELLLEPVKEARFALGWHLPGIRHPDIAAIDALTVILGHGESSRLYSEVRRRAQLVNDVYAYAYTPRDPGLLMVGAGLKGTEIEGALSATLDEVYALRRTLVTKDELEKAKVVILSEAAYQKETVQGEARKVGFFEVVADDYAFEDEYSAKLKALTVEDLRIAARRYLTGAPALVLQAPPESPGVDVATATRIIGESFRRAEAPLARNRKQGALDVTRVELDSGTILLVRHEASPVVAIRAVALGGLRWETRQNHGLAGLFASTWGTATPTLPADALAGRVAVLGGSLSTFAGRNTVGMRGEFIRERGPEGLELFADTLLDSVVTADDLERERVVTLERIRNRHDNPASVAFEVFTEALYPTHSYGLRLIGSEASVAAATVDDIVGVAERFLAPDKLVLSVVGDIDVDATLELLCRRLRSNPTTALPSPNPVDAPPTSLRRGRYALDKQQAHLIIGSMGTTLGDPDRFDLEVLTAVLSGQSGRLFLTLRDQQSLAYSISSSSVEGLDPGYVLIHVATSPDKVPQATAGVYEHLSRLRETPVTPAELARAQRYLTGTHAIDLQRGGARAMLMALNERYDLGYDHYTAYDPAIRAVSAERIQRAAQRYLAADRLVEVVVGPQGCL